jgi:DNA-binding transcriptional ArsR family regulator
MRPTRETDIFHAIAHPARRTILGLLRGGDKPAGALAQSFGVSFSAISQHLRILKDADLVAEHREGRQRIYQLRSAPLAEVWSWIGEFQVYWNARLDALEEHLDREHPPKS